MIEPDQKISVSVVIPVYNVAAFLEECILSVLSQTLSSIEIILVNDGSTDNSAAICQSFVKKDNRIRFINQKNLGVSVARNNGLLYVTGEYVFFMDSDDTIDKHFLYSSYSIAKNENADIILIGSYFLRWMPHVHTLPTCAQMLRVDFLKQHPDIRFPPGIQPCEDGLFSHQLLALSTKLSVNPNGIYHYRDHPNQNHLKINENVGGVLKQIPKWFDILESFYSKNHLFKSYARHLARFMEHEPFGLRYTQMPLNNDQKAYLHSLIKTFMLKNVLPYLTTTDKEYLTPPFLYFIQSDNYADFDNYYISYMARRKKQRKYYMLLTKLVFINKWKQRLRKRIREKFD